MDTQVVTRKELYNLVWSQPILSLAKRYAISDVGLRKICIRISIPLPKAGYWQKLQFGKKISKVPLPHNYKGAEKVTLRLRDADTPLFQKGESPFIILRHQIERDRRLKLAVPHI